MKIRDLTGQKFGYLTVIERAENKKEANGRERVAWKCKCVCGKEIISTTSNLLYGNPEKSCGCKRENNRCVKFQDLTGMKFGKLTVMYEDEPHYTSGGNKVIKWVCRCDCGNTISVRAQALKIGNTSSCGCIKSPDITGKRFGKLVAISKSDKRKNNMSWWKCQCDCGKVLDVRLTSLLTGVTKSCGCSRKVGSTFEDLIGKRFNKLLVLERVGTRWHSPYWKCLCDCGNITYVNSSSLKYGATKGCGCGEGQSLRTHGLSSTRLHGIWNGMKCRCYNKNSTSYKYYGARGIGLCDEWKNDFKAFYEWSIINGYKEDLTIDRIDPNGDYEPLNCRWVDMNTQNNNRRDSVIIEYNGKSQTLSQWAKELNINYATLRNRINQLGWSIEKAFTTTV